MFELAGASKQYDGHIALHPTDLVIERGRTTALIGPSGCGKSTILRLLVGLVRPDSGTVLYQGTPLAPENLQQVRRRIGYVIQEGGLFPHITARGNVALVTDHLGWSHVRTQERLGELRSLVQLPVGLLDRYPAELSGGQRQRVSLMRALVLDPEVLLLDEPLGSLDPMIRFELGQDLKAIFGRLHKTVVLVTHDMNEAGLLAEWVVLLREGRIVQQGAFDDLLNAPQHPFVEEFIRAQRGVLGRAGNDA